MIYLQINGEDLYKSSIDHNSLRNTEKIYYSYNNTAAISVFDLREDNQLNSILGIIRTIFVCGVLTVGI